MTYQTMMAGASWLSGNGRKRGDGLLVLHGRGGSLDGAETGNFFPYLLVSISQTKVRVTYIIVLTELI